MKYINFDKDGNILGINDMKINIPNTSIYKFQGIIPDAYQFYLFIDGVFVKKSNYDELIQQELIDQEAVKQKELKHQQIKQIATLSDQLNIMAGVLAEYILTIPEANRTDIQIKALTAYNKIQNILNT